MPHHPAIPPDASASTIQPWRAILHPLWWSALAVLIINDHVLKAAAPGLVTGKLSDVAGLLLAPALLAALLGLRTRRGHAWAHVAVGAVFAAINLSTHAAAGWEALMALGPLPWAITVDPSDCFALLALPVSWAVLVPKRAHSAAERPQTGTSDASIPLPSGLSRAVAAAGMLVGTIASMGTSPPMTDGPTPMISLRNSIVNTTGTAVSVQVRTLLPTIWLGCPALLESPRDHLVDEHFGPATTYSLAPGATLSLDSSLPVECNAIIVTGAQVATTLVSWRGSDFPLRTVVARADSDNVGPEAIRIVQSAAGYAVGASTDAYILDGPPSTGEQKQSDNTACAPAPEAAGLAWELPVPKGEHRISALTAAPNGCVAMELDHPEDSGLRPNEFRWTVCVPPTAWPFQTDDIIQIRFPEVGEPFSVELSSATHRLRLWRGSQLPEVSPGWAPLVVDDPECGYTIEPDCWTSAAPVVLVSTDTGTLRADPTVPVTVGSDLIFFVRGQRNAVFDAGCIGDLPYGESYIETAVLTALTIDNSPNEGDAHE